MKFSMTLSDIFNELAVGLKVTRVGLYFLIENLRLRAL